jgi:hypothetical protein
MKKLIILILLIAGGIPMVSCRNRPEFENLDNAKEFVLSKLKENYGIDFVFKESRKGGDACDIWKDDYGRKIIDAYVRPKGVEDTVPYEFVYRFITSDDTYVIKDEAHAYFYHKQITDLATPLIPEHEMIVEDKSYCKIDGLERKLGKWTGKESFEQYLKDRDFETVMCIYVKDGLSDDEYVDIIKLIIASIYSENDECNINLIVRKDDTFKNRDGTQGSDLFFQDMNQHPNLTPEFFTTKIILDDISGWRFHNSTIPQK